jgi:dTDP-4-dehydrorhamnose reductase
MMNALIGYSGFVGGTLLRQRAFEALFRSSNMEEIDGRTFDTVVCAGAPAQKWIANREPEEDRLKINGLMAHLQTVQCRTFVLISTVDVFKDSSGSDEDTPVDETDLHAYGLHRRLLEKFVERHFSNHLIVRLPGLVGPGLRKNVIFDLLNNNGLEAIDSRGVFQFYPTVNLWYDIQAALNEGLNLIHLTAEPISVADVSAKGFGKVFDQILPTKTPATYDMRSRHAQIFGTSGNYQYSARDTIQAVRSYAQSEPPNISPGSGAKS